MAKRYSGSLQINVHYTDRGDYRVSVSRGGKSLWHGRINPAPAGFGAGVAYDSPKAYDQIARSALAFADHEVSGTADEADFDANLTGYLIRRSPRGAAVRSHSTVKKSSKQIEQEIAATTGLRDGWTKCRVRAGWPETWDKHLRNWWYTVEKQPSGRWAVGYSHRRGDPDSIDRGGTFATWEAATKFAEEHAGATRWAQ